MTSCEWIDCDAKNDKMSRRRIESVPSAVLTWILSWLRDVELADVHTVCKAWNASAKACESTYPVHPRITENSFAHSASLLRRWMRSATQLDMWYPETLSCAGRIGELAGATRVTNVSLLLGDLDATPWIENLPGSIDTLILQGNLSDACWTRLAKSLTNLDLLSTGARLPNVVFRRLKSLKFVCGIAAASVPVDFILHATDTLAFLEYLDLAWLSGWNNDALQPLRTALLQRQTRMPSFRCLINQRASFDMSRYDFSRLLLDTGAKLLEIDVAESSVAWSEWISDAVPWQRVRVNASTSRDVDAVMGHLTRLCAQDNLVVLLGDHTFALLCATMTPSFRKGQVATVLFDTPEVMSGMGWAAVASCFPGIARVGAFLPRHLLESQNFDALKHLAKFEHMFDCILLPRVVYVETAVVNASLPADAREWRRWDNGALFSHRAVA